MGNMKGFQNWINVKYNKFHQELGAELRMILRNEKTQTIKCNYTKRTWGADDVLEEITITEISLNDENNPIFKGKISYIEDADDVEYEIEYEITDLTADEIFDIIMAIAE